MQYLKEFYKIYRRVFWKYVLYISLIFVSYTYSKEFFHILLRFYNNQTVRLLYFRYATILLMFTLIFIIFYYKFFRKTFAKNCLFMLLSAIIVYSLTLFLYSIELSIPMYIGDYLFYGENLCLIGIILPILINAKNIV